MLSQNQWGGCYVIVTKIKRQEGSKKLPEELKACMEAYHVKPTLADLLTEKEEP